jgi:RNase P subunit RPR2
MALHIEAEGDAANARNTCTRCHQRLVPVDDMAIIPLKAMQIIESELLLKCRCGTWNPIPQRLRVRLCIVLKVG